MSRVLLLATMALLLASAGCASGRHYRTSVPAKIISQDTYLFGEVHLDHDILVLPGVELRIAPGTKILVHPKVSTKIEPRFYSRRLQILVQGTLIAKGSADAPIRLESSDPKQLWGGIILEGGARKNVLRHLRISHADQAVYLVDSSAEISNVQISNSTYGVVLSGKQASANICDSRLQSNEYAVLLYGGARAKLTRTVIRDSQEDGVLVAGGSSFVEHGTIYQGNVRDKRVLGAKLEAKSKAKP